MTTTPPSRSCTSAACTRACISKPWVSTRTWRFFPLTSCPRRSPAGRWRAPLFRALDALAVDDGRRRTSLAPGLLTTLDVERMMKALHRSVVVPPIEIAVDRAARGQVLRDRPPLATRAEHVHQAVDDLAHVARALVAARLRGRDQGSNERPLLVGHVTWVAKLAPVVASAVLIGPHRQPQSPAAHRSTSRSDSSTCSRTDTETLHY